MPYTTGPAIRPDGLLLAGGATLLAIGAIWLAAPNIVATLHKPTTIILYPVDPPPPPPEPQPRPRQQQQPAQAPRDPHLTPVNPIIDTLSPPTEARPFTPEPVAPIELTPGSGSGGAGTVEVTPPKPPVLVPPIPDPHYAAQFQPDYPAGEIRLAREGVVVVRVLIGVDGRVKALEPVSATSEDFLAATRRRALAAWRFKPATRDGMAYEAWKQMRVTFTLKDE